MSTFLASSSLLPAVVTVTLVSLLPAQTFTFGSRNGQHTAYCGLPVGGPSGQNSFTSAAATHDVIAVDDPGAAGVTWSHATSQVDALLIPTSVALAITGSASRGPLTGFGVYATAAAHEEWTITLTATSHFTLNALLTAASSEPSTMPPLSFFVAPNSAGASITPDPGAPPLPYGNILFAPGSMSFAASGTMTAGQYVVSIQGRTEGSSFAYPFSGSYTGSVTLGIATAAAVTMRNAGTNPLSYTCALPTLGQTWQGTVDLTTTGHGMAALFGALAPALVPLPTGQTVLLAGPLLVIGPVVTGPQATFSLTLPADNSLVGFVLPTQAIHFGNAPDFAFSNANDLTLGF